MAAVTSPHGELILQQEDLTGGLPVPPAPQKQTGGTCLISPPVTFLPHYSLSTTDVQVNKQVVTKGVVGTGKALPHSPKAALYLDILSAR